MASSSSGRLSRRPQDAAAQAAQDGAVTAFLDLDNRQTYVADAMAALAESEDPHGPAGNNLAKITRDWGPVSQQAFDATTAYLATSDQYSLTDSAGRPTRVDPVAAQSAFAQVHRGLADAATALDTFYRRNADSLERARSARAAAPAVAAEARKAAQAAEEALTRAENAGLTYPSVLEAAGQLIEALSTLNAADHAGKAVNVRKAAAAVHAAAAEVKDRIASANSLVPTVRGSISSVKTRMEAITTRLESLPGVRSALLREFSAACSNDLVGTDDKARASLAKARVEWAAAGDSLTAKRPEEAADHLARARVELTAAEANCDALIERLRLLRATKADPEAAAKTTRFRLRDAQLLVVDRGRVPEWGSVLDAQAARIDRAVAGLTGSHPDYWSYLADLAAVQTFVKGVVDRVRGQAR